MAVVIRPYLPQERGASPGQARREPQDDGAQPPQHGQASPHGTPRHPHGPLTPIVLHTAAQKS
ncbi:hypothetical protein D3C78_1888400 [compost metagenome]